MTKQNTCPQDIIQNQIIQNNEMINYPMRPIATPQPIEIEEWEKEFDKDFGTFPNEFAWKTIHKDNTICSFCGHPANPNEVLNNVKDFIKKQTDLAYQKGLGERKSVVEEVVREMWGEAVGNYDILNSDSIAIVDSIINYANSKGISLTNKE